MGKGVVLRDVSTPGFPSSKKRQDLHVAQFLKKLKTYSAKASIERVIVETEDKSKSNGLPKRVFDSFEVSP